ncbi:hypothetical protein ACIBCT_05225 [Streptosporangium sp. NPDC050855]|uniref:hypothetical protein n=1 Tax=Streptosporangium sp. NPDC050855 TaxID=3366194 RepID=UPI0037AC2D30
MENDFRPDGGEGPLTSSQARDTLDRLGLDGARLAERVVTPWWYHPVLGLIVGVLTGAQALPGVASFIVMALGIVAIPLLITTYNRRYGISITQPAGPRGRRLSHTMLGVLVLAMLAALVVKFTGTAPWWGLLPAAFAFGVIVVFGRRYDDVLRDELAHGAGGRA